MSAVGLAASRRHPTGSKRAAPKGCNPANTGGQLAARTERAGRTATLGKPGGVGTSWPERFRAQRENEDLRRLEEPTATAAQGSVSAGPGAAAYWGVAGTPAEGVVEDRLPGWSEGEASPFASQEMRAGCRNLTPVQNDKAPPKRGFAIDWYASITR